MRAYLALLALVLLAPAAFAGHYCGCECPTYHTEVDLGPVMVAEGTTPGGFAATLTKTGQYYIAQDWLYVNNLHHFGGFSLWFYEESNGMDGLQRGDEVCVNTPDGVEPDTIIT